MLLAELDGKQQGSPDHLEQPEVGLVLHEAQLVVDRAKAILQKVEVGVMPVVHPPVGFQVLGHGMKSAASRDG